MSKLTAAAEPSRQTPAEALVTQSGGRHDETVTLDGDPTGPDGVEVDEGIRRRLLAIIGEYKAPAEIDRYVAEHGLSDHVWCHRLLAESYLAQEDWVQSCVRWGRVLALEPGDVCAQASVLSCLDKLDGNIRKKVIAEISVALCSAWESQHIDRTMMPYLDWASIFSTMDGDGQSNVFIVSLFKRLYWTADRNRLESIIETRIDDLAKHANYISNIIRKTPLFEDALRNFQIRLIQATEDPKVLMGCVQDAIASVNIDLARDAAFRLRRIAKTPNATKTIEKFEAYLLSGDAFLSAGDLEKAEEYYLTAGKIKPKALICALGVACTLLDRGQLDRSAEWFERSLSLVQSNDPAGLSGLIGHRLDELRRHNDGVRDQSLELLIFSHATEKIKVNTHLAPPKTEMIETIFHNVTERLADGDHITSLIMYDHRDTALSAAYLANLQVLAQEQKAELVVNHGNGLRRQWIDGLPRGDSDLVLIMEQDFLLLAQCPDWRTARELFRNRPDISHLKFNKRKNIRRFFDQSAYQTARDARSGILRTTKHSNNPHIMRRSFYNDVIFPIIRGSANLDTGNGGAAGVEENVNIFVNAVTFRLGLPIASRLFGFAIWGNRDEPPACQTFGF